MLEGKSIQVQVLQGLLPVARCVILEATWSQLERPGANGKSIILQP